jgi:hypothetical protein
MEKNRAPVARHRRIGVVTNLDQPAICEVVVPHFLFVEPRRRICRVIDSDETIVVGIGNVIHPGIGGRNLMKGIIRPRRQLRVVSVNLSETKNSGRGALIALFLAQPVFLLPGEATAPGEAFFAE